jgi:hypothetical protein
MKGIICLEGVLYNNKILPWNSLHHIRDTMLFIHNNWARLKIKPYIGYTVDFLLSKTGEIYDCAILENNKAISKARQEEIESNYKNIKYEK